MSHLLQRTIDIANPYGTCNKCQKTGRVFCIYESYENQFCHDCCGVKWSEMPTALKIAELAQSFQVHEPMHIVENFKPIWIEPNGERYVHD